LLILSHCVIGALNGKDEVSTHLILFVDHNDDKDGDDDDDSGDDDRDGD